jgi:hypothetical protein
MAVTPTHDLPGRRQQSDPNAQSSSGRDPDSERRTDDGTQAEGESDSQPPPGKSKKMRILGGVGVFVVLALYFVWIGEEMGGHAISGTTEMLAIFGAILLGVVALVAGGALSRKTTDSGEQHDKR